MICFDPNFDPSRDHADLRPNASGIIGDSRCKRYTYVASLTEPGIIYEIDWHAKWPDGRSAHDLLYGPFTFK